MYDIDWYHNQSRVNAEWFLSKQNLDAAEPMPRKDKKWCFIIEYELADNIEP